nr:uncharacterized protein LOC109619238 [Crassostrea gigas]
MISHDISAKICMCCNDITGSDISGSNWKTFIEPHCANGSAPYNLLGSQICLKYFPVPVIYATAKANCEAEGGNLIKIDSQEKYNIFNDYHVSVANNTVIQVWVQGEKIGGQWKFDDGTPIPEYCRFSMSNGPNEVHMRAFGSTSFACGDNPNGSPFNYSCEYPRLSSIQN